MEEEDVLVDCVERTRGTWTDARLYPVYPNTKNGNEVDAVCWFAEKAGLMPAELTRAKPTATPRQAAIPESKPPVRTELKASSGSAFFVASNLVVTNYHVIEGCTKYTIRRDTKTYSATVQATANRSDLALLLVDTIAQSVPLIRAGAALGEDVMIAGHPLSGFLAQDLIVAGGQVNSLAGINNDPSFLQISAPVQPGNSGGPVIDRFGNIVGVVVSKVNVLKLATLTGDFAQNINFAIKPEVLRMFLDANRVQYKTGGLGKRLEGVDLAERARSFTVQVSCTQ